MTPRKRVRAGTVYTFRPCIMDVVLSQHHSATEGQRVRVVNLRGAPPCNTMGMAHIEDAHTGALLGIVSVHSLEKAR